MSLNKLDSINSYYRIHWGKGWNGKKYIVQQKTYKESEDAIFRINDSINWVSAAESKGSEYNENLENLIPNELSSKLSYTLSKLKPSEERVLRMRYGLGMDKPMTLEEIGQQFFVTRERIRQIEAKALRNMRRILKATEADPC
jgi:RNA polymerase sigma factor (sigma-70 family)